MTGSADFQSTQTVRIDPILLASLIWPVTFVVGQLFPGPSPLVFWQIYYLTLPHRWLTLIVVATDPDRRKNRGWWILISMALSASVVGGVLFASGMLLCLALADHLWNAWHFGSQHGGIARMYGLKYGQNKPILDRWGLRVLVFYALVRPVEWSFKWIEPGSMADIILAQFDYMAIAAACGMTLAAILPYQKMNYPRALYYASTGMLYGGIIMACRLSAGPVVSSLLFGSAVFHGLEYIAFVSSYSTTRSGRASLLGKLAKDWISFLMIYIVILGTIGVITDSFPESSRYWTALNLWAAFSHYWLDGMIWKFRDTNLVRDLTGLR